MLLYSSVDSIDKKPCVREWIEKQFNKHDWCLGWNQLKFIKVLSEGGCIITKSHRNSGMSTMIVMHICYNILHGNFINVAVIGIGIENAWYREAIKKVLMDCDEVVYVHKDYSFKLSFTVQGNVKTINYIPYDNVTSYVCGKKFDFISIDSAAFLPNLERKAIMLKTCTSNFIIASCPKVSDSCDFKRIYEGAMKSLNSWRAFSFSWYMDTRKYPKVCWFPKQIDASKQFLDRDSIIKDNYRTEEYALSMYSAGYTPYIDMSFPEHGENVETEIYGNFK